MKPQGRLGDSANCPSDGHGCKGCTHNVTGPAVMGSTDVFVNSKPALRVGDAGIHAACCGPNVWNAAAGSATVFINGKAAHRMGDATSHCGGSGNLIAGSGDVFVGDSASSGGASSSKDSTCGICSLKKGAVPPPAEKAPSANPENSVHVGNNVFIGSGGGSKPESEKPAPKESPILKEQNERIEEQKATMAEAVAPPLPEKKKESKITNPKWKNMNGEDITQANVGNDVKLTADVSGIDNGSLAKVLIYEKDEVGENDKVTTQTVSIKDNKIEMEWEVVYIEDTDDVESAAEEAEKGYTLPEYIFEIEQAQVSKKVESPELEVVDWFEIELNDDEADEPIAGAGFKLILNEEVVYKGNVDSDGHARVEGLKPGKYILELDDDEFVEYKKM